MDTRASVAPINISTCSALIDHNPDLDAHTSSPLVSVGSVRLQTSPFSELVNASTDMPGPAGRGRSRAVAWGFAQQGALDRYAGWIAGRGVAVARRGLRRPMHLQSSASRSAGLQKTVQDRVLNSGCSHLYRVRVLSEGGVFQIAVTPWIRLTRGV
ncbi:hypothetical protein OBBRIDRAFT_790225 [Obba rivulosa]|uniref:Uncharacterized protein n=1 Tax=Obba rivulosa TaxID=1052685 RepID=A0A8E2DPR4_9APHY|nr:hypothetical protein OBBRIDRAFT_790225 [Obba rivulosa]